MRLRAYLLLANGVSIGIILLSLFVCYRYMLLNGPETMLLVSVTLGAAAVSFIVHFALTQRLEKSLQRLTEETEHIAKGHFDGMAPVIGPAEFRRLAERFNEMSIKLSDSFKRIRSSEASRRELVANVSHDLRTPLASVQSFVEALQDDIVQDKETFQRYLRTIRHETQRLSRLIDDLFELSQLHAGARVWTPEPCHSDSLIVDVLHSHELQLEEKRLDVHVRVPDDLPPLHAMPYELKRVLSNLLQNAVRHSPAGSRIELEANLLPDQRYVRITIDDEGEGVAREERELIFERLYRSDRSRTRASGGSGLGLAIAKSIVQLHGGDIGVEPRQGGGSRFWFTVMTASEANQYDSQI
ncbi:HAMP domain-containing sensor histidine kinase [Cohnella terricola]|nr:HAMP domain-containing sensor histidine kinase [Cohnella terricola]